MAGESPKKKFITKEDVIKELVSNPDYAENVEDMLSCWFDRCPSSFQEWLDWFNGK